MLRTLLISLVLGTTGGVRMEVQPPGGKPGVICTLPAVDCSAPDEETQAQCTALALQGKQVVVVRSKEKTKKFLVAIWGDACK